MWHLIKGIEPETVEKVKLVSALLPSLPCCAPNLAQVRLHEKG